MQWFHDVFNASGSNLCPLFLSGNNFFLFSWFSALLNSHKIAFRQLHAFLKWFCFDSLIASELCIEFFNNDRCVELDNKEGFISQFENVCGIGVFSEVLAKIFVA